MLGAIRRVGEYERVCAIHYIGIGNEYLARRDFFRGQRMLGFKEIEHVLRNIRILHGAVERDVRDRVVILLEQQRNVLPELFAVDSQLSVKAVSDYSAVIGDVGSEVLSGGVQIDLVVFFINRVAVFICNRVAVFILYLNGLAAVIELIRRAAQVGLLVTGKSVRLLLGDVVGVGIALGVIFFKTAEGVRPFVVAVQSALLPLVLLAAVLFRRLGIGGFAVQLEEKVGTCVLGVCVVRPSLVNGDACFVLKGVGDLDRMQVVGLCLFALDDGFVGDGDNAVVAADADLSVLVYGAVADFDFLDLVFDQLARLVVLGQVEDIVGVGSVADRYQILRRDLLNQSQALAGDAQSDLVDRIILSCESVADIPVELDLVADYADSCVDKAQGSVGAVYAAAVVNLTHSVVVTVLRVAVDRLALVNTGEISETDTVLFCHIDAVAVVKIFSPVNNSSARRPVITRQQLLYPLCFVSESRINF